MSHLTQPPTPSINYSKRIRNMRGGVHGQHPYHHQHNIVDGDRKPYDDIIEVWGEPPLYMYMRT
jgi:hypothetical protein